MALQLPFADFDLAVAEWLTFPGAGTRWSHARWHLFRCDCDEREPYPEDIQELDYYLVRDWPNSRGDRFLYFARGESLAIKVGISGNPVVRAQALKSRLLLQVSGCDRDHERAVHSLLDVERLARDESPGGREWFRGPGVELLLALAGARAQRGAA